jgi:hypothetical protein
MPYVINFVGFTPCWCDNAGCLGVQRIIDELNKFGGDVAQEVI